MKSHDRETITLEKRRRDGRDGVPRDAEDREAVAVDDALVVLECRVRAWRKERRAFGGKTPRALEGGRRQPQLSPSVSAALKRKKDASHAPIEPDVSRQIAMSAPGRRPGGALGTLTRMRTSAMPEGALEVTRIDTGGRTTSVVMRRAAASSESERFNAGAGGGGDASAPPPPAPAAAISWFIPRDRIENESENGTRSDVGDRQISIDKVNSGGLERWR